MGWRRRRFLPAAELTPYSLRASISYEEAARFSLPPAALVGLVAPWVYGRGPDAFTGDWDRVEVGYLGAIALLFALYGAWQTRGTWQTRGARLTRFWVGFGLLALLMALGQSTPLHRLVYELPLMNSLRAPARFVLLFDFAAAGLAAVGLRVAAPRLGSAAQRLPARLGFLADRQVVGLVAVALLAAELVATGAGVETDAGSPYAGYDHPAVVAWLRAQPGRFRIEGAAPDWQPDAAAFHGLHDIYGVHNPLALAAYESFYWSVGERGTPPYNYLGARYVIRPKDDPPAGDPYAAAFTPAFDNDPTLTVYENAGALPLAHVIPRAEVVARPEAAWDAIHAPDWDPAALAYVEGGPPLNYPLPEDAHFSVENVVYEANRLEYTIDVAGPAYLVLSEVYYPGWRATVDGAPAVVYRANTAFRAVYVGEPGTHTVALVFAPASFTLGAALSLLTLAALAAGVTVGVWWRRR
ncbi:MAG: YfhO family protein [Anaerolineae bacterium]|nr:YfhO family protein [Anaerolineae bacterium]